MKKIKKKKGNHSLVQTIVMNLAQQEPQSLLLDFAFVTMFPLLIDLDAHLSEANFWSKGAMVPPESKGS